MLGKVGKAVREKNPGNFSQSTVYEALGFKHNLKYGPRSKLRKLCSRFLRFSYLMDFIALETLASIFVESVRDTFFLFRDLSQVKPDFELAPILRNALGEVVQTTAQKKTTGDYTQAPVPVPLFKV